MKLEQFIEENIKLIDDGDFERLLDLVFILDRYDIEALVDMLSEVFTEDIKIAAEKHLDKLLRNAFIKHKLELPLEISDFLDCYNYSIPGYDNYSLAQYLRKNGLKYGVKIVDNPGYEPFIQYIKEI